jgi:serine/threonine protein phosphatase PrpC
MGTTLLAVLLTEDGQLQWISVGDSPLWLLRDGALQRLNEDHSMAGAFSELVAVGRMTAKSAQIASNRSALRSVVAGGPIDLIDLPAPVKLKAGDTVVLASDGLLTVEPEVLTERLTEAANLQMEIVVSALLNAVEERREPEQDNTTLIVAQVCSR